MFFVGFADGFTEGSRVVGPDEGLKDGLLEGCALGACDGSAAG